MNVSKNLYKPMSLFVILLGLVLVLSASMGAVSISTLDVISYSLTDQEKAILYSIRLPRVLLGALVGAALAISGAALQGLFRNPLADPGIIGISSGAALMVALIIVFSGSFSSLLGLYSLSVAAFVGGLLTSMAIFYLAHLTGTLSITYMLLSGLAINALAAASTSVLIYISNDQQLRTLTFWTMGSLSGALWPSVTVVSTIVLPTTFLLMRYAKDLNLLVLGEEEAKSLGVHSERLKQKIILCSVLSIGAAVSVSGMIGFVGLIVPHLVRLAIGPSHRFLIPASALLGATLLVLADTFSRIIIAPAELPVGILTSLIGGPFFLWLLVRQYSGRFGV